LPPRACDLSPDNHSSFAAKYPVSWPFRSGNFNAEDFDWLRTFADHAAVAIANARAFEEIESLKKRLEQENDYLREEVIAALGLREIIGESSALKKVLRQIELVAPTDAAVLVHGESGTGKELVARAIHERSQRRERPLIKVNAAQFQKTF
jgi:transcriptional regulator with GAF, ATPase, and Fis domain